MELMIVVAVVAVLTVLAIASYDFATVKTRRNLATACISQRAQQLQRFKTVGITGTTGFTYNGTGTPALSGGCIAQLSEFYSFAYNPALTANTFTIVATPVGRQLAKDKLCGALSMNQNGLKGETGTGQPSDCW